MGNNPSKQKAQQGFGFQPVPNGQGYYGPNPFAPPQMAFVPQMATMMAPRRASTRRRSKRSSRRASTKSRTAASAFEPAVFPCMPIFACSNSSSSCSYQLPPVRSPCTAGKIQSFLERTFLPKPGREAIQLVALKHHTQRSQSCLMMIRPRKMTWRKIQNHIGSLS